MGDEDGDGAGLAQRVGDDCGVGRGAGLEVESGDVGAEGLGDVAEAVAELTDRDGEDVVAGGERVDDGGFHGAGAGGGEDVDLVLGAEEELQALHDARLHLGELGSAVVDHLARELGERLGRAGGGAGNTQVLHDKVSVLGMDSPFGELRTGALRSSGRVMVGSYRGGV